MSYRTNDKLHVVLACGIGLVAILTGGIGGGCWWQLFAKTPLDGSPNFWVMLSLAVVITVVALIMLAVSVWAIVDVVRVRRM